MVYGLLSCLPTASSLEPLIALRMLSSLEPLTTLRVVTGSAQCIRQSLNPKYSKIASIIVKGRIMRISNLKCTRIIQITLNRKLSRIVSVGVLKNSPNTQLTRMIQFIHLEEDQRPLWMCILLDLFVDVF